jgi:hypothetical protein
LQRYISQINDHALQVFLSLVGRRSLFEIEEVPEEGAVSRLGLASFSAAKLYADKAVIGGRRVGLRGKKEELGFRLRLRLRLGSG